MTKIHFTQNGWTSLISDELTIENIKILAQAVCNYFRREQNYIDNFPPRLAIGYDSRFLGERYADEISSLVIKNGFDVYLSDRPSPTPAILWSVKDIVLTGGILITGGDLPYEFSGVKIISPQGSILSEKLTKEIEKEIDFIEENGLPDFPITPGEITEFNPKNYYFHQLSSIINLHKIAIAGIDITVDCLNGATSGYLKDLLFKHDCMIREINNTMSFDFAKIVPNLNKKNLQALQQIVLTPRTNLQVGIAFDGDGSKLRVVDVSGSVVSDEFIFCLLLKHLVENKEIKQGVVKPANEGKLIEKLTKKYDIPVYESKSKDSRVISEFMRTNDCMLGSTLDGDYHINLNHVLEKDGILASLLILETIATYKQNVNYLINQICNELT